MQCAILVAYDDDNLYVAWKAFDPRPAEIRARPFIQPRTETLFTQLGYSDNRLGQQELSLEQTDRTLFFKVGYAWVM